MILLLLLPVIVTQLLWSKEVFSKVDFVKEQDQEVNESKWGKCTKYCVSDL